jgi:hypothetical protein
MEYSDYFFSQSIGALAKNCLEDSVNGHLFNPVPVGLTEFCHYSDGKHGSGAELVLNMYLWK